MREGLEIMRDNVNIDIPNDERESLIEILTEELPVLRAKIGISQNDLSKMIGVSRQTYSSIETKKWKMTWNMFLSLLFVFRYNDKTSEILERVGVFPESLKNMLNIDNR